MADRCSVGTPVARRADDEPPSLAMVAAGGVGVLAVVAFVAAVSFGARPVPPAAGERIGMTSRGRPSEPTVAVARCPVERVVDVAVLDADGEVRWRISSSKGSIDTRYVVGADAPTGFETVVSSDDPLAGGILEVRVAIDREGEVHRDRQRFSEADVPPPDAVRYRGSAVEPRVFDARGLAAAGCPGSGGGRGVAPWLFAAGAGAVVVTYLGMVARWWRARRRG